MIHVLIVASINNSGSVVLLLNVLLLQLLLFKKNMHAAKPHQQSKGVRGIRTLGVRTKTLHVVLKGFPNVIT